MGTESKAGRRLEPTAGGKGHRARLKNAAGSRANISAAQQQLFDRKCRRYQA